MFKLSQDAVQSWSQARCCLNPNELRCLPSSLWLALAESADFAVMSRSLECAEDASPDANLQDGKAAWGLQDSGKESLLPRFAK